MRTKQGYAMNLRLRAKIVALAALNRGLPLVELAVQLGISRRTLQD